MPNYDRPAPAARRNSNPKPTVDFGRRYRPSKSVEAMVAATNAKTERANKYDEAIRKGKRNAEYRARLAPSAAAARAARAQSEPLFGTSVGLNTTTGRQYRKIRQYED